MPALLGALLAAISPLPLDRAPAPPPTETGAPRPIIGKATSADGEWTVVLFGRTASPEDTPDDALWLQSESTLELTCLFGRECAYPDRQAWGIGLPIFGVDNREMFFVATFYVHDTADIYRLDLATRQLTLIGEGVSLMVVRDGPHQGDLIVKRRTACAQEGCFYYPAFLIHPDGQPVLRIPDANPRADGEASAKAWLAGNGWHAS